MKNKSAVSVVLLMIALFLSGVGGCSKPPESFTIIGRPLTFNPEHSSRNGSFSVLVETNEQKFFAYTPSPWWLSTVDETRINTVAKTLIMAKMNENEKERTEITMTGSYEEGNRFRLSKIEVYGQVVIWQ